MSGELAFVELFAAPGGMSLGFKMAGFKPLAAFDIDPRGMQTYSYNFPEAAVFAGPEDADVRKLETKRVMETLGISGGELDLVIGGPPCQGFSTVGRVKIASLVRSGVWDHLKVSTPRFIDDPRNVLYKEFVRFVKDLQPKYFVMENVPSMMSYRDGEIVKQIKEDFAAIGYRTDARVLNAVDFGVPQHRKRIIFIGNRLGLPNPFPSPWNTLDAYFEGEKENGRHNGFRPPWRTPVTVWDAIGDLPDPVEGRPKVADAPLEYSKPPQSEYQRWAREWGGGPPDGKIHNHVARQHSERDVKVFSIMGEGTLWKHLSPEIKALYGYRDDVFHDKFKRLARDRPSWTVVAHLAKDGYMYIHPTQPRTITVREAARLQGFPDRFIFRGSRTDQFRQVGNAVPPLLAMAVAIEIKKVLQAKLR